jgi:serine/threonine-protein kinase
LLDQGVAAVAKEMFGSLTPSGAPNQSFGPYRLTRMLGEGGMGVVYLGQRDDIGAVAAIKILRTHGCLRPDASGSPRTTHARAAQSSR